MPFRFGLYQHLKTGNWYRALDLVRPVTRPTQIDLVYEQLYESKLREGEKTNNPSVPLPYGTKWTRELEDFTAKFRHHIALVRTFDDNNSKVYKLPYKPFFENMKDCSYTLKNNQLEKSYLSKQKQYLNEDSEEYKLIKGLYDNEFQEDLTDANIGFSAKDELICITTKS